MPDLTRINTLLRCPFCGSKANVRECHCPPAPINYQVWCSKCLARGPYYRRKSAAIAAWNRRSKSLPTIESMIGIYKEDSNG